MKWSQVKSLLKAEGINDDSEVLNIDVQKVDEYPQPVVSGAPPVPPTLRVRVVFKKGA